MFNKEFEKENKEIQVNISFIQKKILVMSGQGAVGKSTISAHLAGFLSLEGYHVGLLDIDLHGPSIPKFFGISDKKVEVDGQHILPISYCESLKIVSLGNMIENEGTSIIWRGPQKSGTIRKLLKDVKWGHLDYLVIDSPPGTGDEQLSVIQGINELTGALIVTTPQDIALIDVRKSINFCRKLNLPILGIVENMSGLTCPHCHGAINLFKVGGGEQLARNEGIPFLGRISIDPQTAIQSDEGNLIINLPNNSINKEEMRNVFTNLLGGLK